MAAVLVSSVALAQVRTAGQIVGVVQDPTGAVVPGAKVVAVDEATGVTKEATSGSDGQFIIPDLFFGSYRVTITSQGFRTAVYPGVKVEAGRTANLTVKLELGTSAETITVEAGTDVLQTTSPTVENTVTGKELRSLPLNNRDALDFVTLLPGANQAGSARQSTFYNLPKGALNVTIDGLNVQDNLLKSSFGGGMFTLIRPKIDSVEEVSVKGVAGGADAGGEGAVHIGFVTRRGGNDYNGTAFWYWRHESLNANTWLNNANNLARNINRLHTYGFNLGGPFIKEKVFFFFSYEDFRLPEQRQRLNTVLTPLAQTGIFSYRPTATQGAAPNAFTTCDTATAPNQICQVNLLNLAAANMLPSAIDPLVQSMFDVINPIVSGKTAAFDLIRERFPFAALGGQRRWFPSLRMDWNVTPKLRWHGVAHFNRFVSTPDTLNSMDPTFPGLASNQQFFGGQYSNRMQLTTGLNWDIKPNMSYELRVGRQSSVVQFFPETLPGTGLPNDLLALYNQGFRLGWPLGVQSLHVRPGLAGTSRSLPSSRTVPVMQWGNNLYWQKGKHGLNFGSNLTVVTHWDGSFGSAGIPFISLGLGTLDPAAAVIAGANLPGMSTTDQGNARALYALLTARVSNISGSSNVNEITKNYGALAPLTQRNRQNELGLYATDQWRLIPTLTVTAGVRWEYQGAPFNRNDIYASPTFGDIWGRSGVGNLFAPGTLTGNATPTLDQRSRGAWDRYFNAWAPNFGLSWQPKNDSNWYRWIFGGTGKSVFRSGYSIAFTREGFVHFPSYMGTGNPGLTQTNVASAGVDYCTATLACLNLTGVDLANGTPALRNAPAIFSFPVPQSNFTFTSSLNTIDPNLKPGYVQSWNLSWQREINASTAIDVRYTGNHGTRLWRGINLNEYNIFENGFLQEFINGQSNLAICQANSAACIAAQAAAGVTAANQTANSFANWGLTGQVALPIYTAAFTGSTTGAQTNANFRAGGTFVQDLTTGQAGLTANRIGASSTFLCNMVGRNGLTFCAARSLGPATGAFPANFFQVNPDLAGVGAFLLTNLSNSTYHGVTVEVRRRLSKGLLVNGHYTFSKGLTDRYDDAADSFANYATLRNLQYNKGLSPYDITHTMRLRFIYEFPFGPGRRWSSSNPAVSRIIEGWGLTGVFALQSGRPFLLTSGRATVNQFESGVVSNLTRDQLQDLVGIVQEPGRKHVLFFDPSAIASNGQACGFTAGNCATSLLEPNVTPGVLGQRIFLKGPKFFKPDITIVKNTSITERIKLEFRTEIFNFVNYTNWLVGGPGAVADTVAIGGTTFGQTTNFFNDLGNQDQGPRMIQFVFRLNF